MNQEEADQDVVDEVSRAKMAALDRAGERSRSLYSPCSTGSDKTQVRHRLCT